MKQIYLILTVCTFLLIGGCKKTEDNPQAVNSDTDTAGAENVFICGAAEQNGKVMVALWNKRNNKLLTEGTGRAVAVTDNDISVAFYRNVNGYNRSFIWENGVITEIQSANATTDTRPVDIEYSGGSLYVALEEFSSNPYKQSAVIWKDGQRTDLPDSGGKVDITSLFVEGSDVYASGSYYSPFHGNSIACVWKNNTLIPLGKSDMNSIARDVFVSTGNIHATGYRFYNAYYGSMAWRNSSEDTLPQSGNQCYPSSIWVDGANELILAADYSGIVVWKNGIAAMLPGSEDDQAFISTQKIIVKQGKTYILSNYDKDDIAYNYLWINNEKHLIAKGEYAIAFGMAVR